MRNKGVVIVLTIIIIIPAPTMRLNEAFMARPKSRINLEKLGINFPKRMNLNNLNTLKSNK